MTDLQHGQMTDLLQNDLKHNADVRAISFSIQREKQRILALEAKTRTLSMIDELDGPILDVLSVELRIPYYSQADSVERKRTIVKTAMLWYYKAGTVEGLMTALRSVHGGCSVEEWFQYDGDPGYFRVGIDITDPEEVLDLNWLTGIVRTYKPVRAHLEDDAIAFRTIQHILVGLTTGFVAYTAPRCGTRPGPATVGGLSRSNVRIRADPLGTGYTAPETGRTIAGTRPINSTVGIITDQPVSVLTGADGTGYTAPGTGETIAGTRPINSTIGIITEQPVSVLAGADGTDYAAPKSGTRPNASVVGAIAQQGIRLDDETAGTDYAAPKSGTRPNASVVGLIAQQGIQLDKEASGTDYTAPKSGTRPEASTVGTIAEQAIEATDEAEGTGYDAPRSGTLPQGAETGASAGSGLKTSVTADGTTYSGPVCGGNEYF